MRFLVRFPGRSNAELAGLEHGWSVSKLLEVRKQCYHLACNPRVRAAHLGWWSYPLEPLSCGAWLLPALQPLPSSFLLLFGHPVTFALRAQFHPESHIMNMMSLDGSSDHLWLAENLNQTSNRENKTTYSLLHKSLSRLRQVTSRLPQVAPILRGLKEKIRPTTLLKKKTLWRIVIDADLLPEEWFSTKCQSVYGLSHGLRQNGLWHHGYVQ
jgi:hypothetical protein